MINKANLCPICSGSKGRGHTAFTVDMGFGVVVIRNVPASICSICGEEWIEDKVSENLEKIVSAIKDKHCMVEVADYKYESRNLVST